MPLKEEESLKQDRQSYGKINSTSTICLFWSKELNLKVIIEVILQKKYLGRKLFDQNGLVVKTTECCNARGTFNGLIGTKDWGPLDTLSNAYLVATEQKVKEMT